MFLSHKLHFFENNLKTIQMFKKKTKTFVRFSEKQIPHTLQFIEYTIKKRQL